MPIEILKNSQNQKKKKKSLGFPVVHGQTASQPPRMAWPPMSAVYVSREVLGKTAQDQGE